MHPSWTASNIGGGGSGPDVRHRPAEGYYATALVKHIEAHRSAVRRAAVLALIAAPVTAQRPERDASPFELIPLVALHENHSGPGSAADNAITHMVGAGACVIDYDQDGLWDLFVPDRRLAGVSDSGNHLYRGRGALGFEDVTTRARIRTDGWSVGCAVADVDNDGDPDLFVTRIGTNILWRNLGDGTFEAHGGFTDESAWSTSATFSDLDRDGFADLYVCNYIDLGRVDLTARCPYYGIDVFCGPNGLPGAPDVLYRNVPHEGFRDVTGQAGVFSPETRGFSVLAVDLDADGLPELHVANDAGTDLLFRNRGDFRFENVSLVSGAGYSGAGMEQSGMGSTAGDYDGDGDDDLYVTNFQRDYNTLYRNEGSLTFTDVTGASGLALPTLARLAWGTLFLDVGNDGFLDLFVANGHIYPELQAHPEIGEPYRQPVQLFRGLGEGRFHETRPAASSPPRLGRGTALFDVDDNGALDLVVNNLDARADLYLGRETEADWVRLRLVGTSSNREGLNAVAVAHTGPREIRRELRVSDGFLGSNEPVIQFGLEHGAAGIHAEVSISWPSGAIDRCTELKARRTYVVKEGVGCLD